jgi:hypothetical protein
MAVVRVYVPLGRADLLALASTGSLAASAGSPRPAYAVTALLRTSAPGLDVEDLEFAAFSDAVQAAAAHRAVPAHRRVVVAADADPSWVAPGAGDPLSVVELVADLPLARVASFHVDDEVTGGGGGGVEEEPDELLWYDVTELDDVCGFLA